MSTIMKEGSGKEPPRHSRLGLGRHDAGKWYCECGRAASCLTTKKSGLNHGRKFWRCPQSFDVAQCPFFLWTEDEAAAKEWLSSSQLLSLPQTPIKTSTKCDEQDLTIVSGSRDQSPETPFRNAKRKGLSNQNTDGNEGALQPQIVLDNQHSRKAARTSTLSTPGQPFTERLKRSPVSLPTPNSQEHRSMSNATASQLYNTSPTPGRFTDQTGLDSSAESDLTTTVLELIRSDIPKLKASTEVRLRHEIGLILDVSETKLRRYGETIYELRKRIDELETVVLHLTAHSERE